MNKDRRKAIDAVLADMGKGRDLLAEAQALLEGAASSLEDIRSEEEEYRDNMPENMRDGDKGSMADEAISNLEEANSEATTAAEGAQEVLDSLDKVITDLKDEVLAELDGGSFIDSIENAESAAENAKG